MAENTEMQRSEVAPLISLIRKNGLRRLETFVTNCVSGVESETEVGQVLIGRLFRLAL